MDRSKFIRSCQYWKASTNQIVKLTPVRNDSNIQMVCLMACLPKSLRHSSALLQALAGVGAALYLLFQPCKPVYPSGLKTRNIRRTRAMQLRLRQTKTSPSAAICEVSTATWTSTPAWSRPMASSACGSSQARAPVDAPRRTRPARPSTWRATSSSAASASAGEETAGAFDQALANSRGHHALTLAQQQGSAQAGFQFGHVQADRWHGQMQARAAAANEPISDSGLQLVNWSRRSGFLYLAFMTFNFTNLFRAPQSPSHHDREHP